ncbi:MAG: lipopolysaccharide biosynthesis protein [Coriobacteriales bacterium]
MVRKPGKTYEALLWKLLERGGSKVLRLVVQIVLARILAPEEFGLLAIMLVFISLGDIIVLGGLNSALIQKENPATVEYSTAFWLSIGFSLASFIILALLAVPIANFYSEPVLVIPLQVLALQFFPLSFNSIQVAKTTKQLNMRPVFVGAIVAEITASIVAIWMAMVGYGLWSLIAQQLVAALVACCVTALFVRWHPTLDFSKQTAKELLSFGWNVMGTELLNSAASSIYTLLIGRWYSAKDLGYYSQGQRYPSALCEVITGALAPVLLADFSNRRLQSRHHLREGLRKANRETALIMAPTVAVMFLYAEPIVQFVLTDKWLPCVTILQLFCIVSFLKSMSLIGRQALLAIGRSELPMRIAILRLLLSIALLAIVFVSGADIYFATVAWTLTGFFEQVATSFYCKKTLEYSYAQQFLDICVPVIICAACALFAIAVFLLDIMPDLVSAIVYLIIYCAIVFFIYRRPKAKE